MTGWRRIDDPSERTALIAAATERVLAVRTAAEGMPVSELKTRDGEYWVRETASGVQTHGAWMLPGGPPAVLGDLQAHDDDPVGAWRAIRELADRRPATESVAFSAYHGDDFTQGLADAAPATRVATKMQQSVADVPPAARITTRPMTAGEFDDYLAGSARAYADELLASGAVTTDEAAMAEAEAGMARLLPDGLDTAGQRLWTVCDEAGRPVGRLWVHLQEHHGFIYDIEMRESVRGQGLGTHTLRAAAAHTREAGLTLLALNVFGSNDAARRLYVREGYTETEIIWSARTNA